MKINKWRAAVFPLCFCNIYERYDQKMATYIAQLFKFKITHFSPCIRPSYSGKFKGGIAVLGTQLTEHGQFY
jgi:hypothetical protein